MIAAIMMHIIHIISPHTLIRGKANIRATLARWPGLESPIGLLLGRHRHTANRALQSTGQCGAASATRRVRAVDWLMGTIACGNVAYN